MELELAYRPTGKQLAFHASTADEVLYGGAAGGGKSYAICWDALMRCLKYPQTHAYLFRRTYPELEMTLVRTMMRIAPKELGKYVSSAHELRLKQLGSVIHFCHLSNEGEGLLSTRARRSTGCISTSSRISRNPCMTTCGRGCARKSGWALRPVCDAQATPAGRGTHG